MERSEEGVRLRKALQVAAPPRGCRRFPEPLMREVVAYLEARRAEGIGVETVGREIGLAGNTLRHWKDRIGATSRASMPETNSTPPSTFLPLALLAPAPTVFPPSLAVCTPQGLRVEGLDVAQLAELLRRLS